jgi:hypothetical protein
MSSQSTSVTVKEFGEMITAAVEQRKRNYLNAFSISFRWENDNSNPEADVGHFQAILVTLGLPRAREFVISKDSQVPGWDVRDELAKIIRHVTPLDNMAELSFSFIMQDTAVISTTLSFSVHPRHPRRSLTLTTPFFIPAV